MGEWGLSSGRLQLMCLPSVVEPSIKYSCHTSTTTLTKSPENVTRTILSYFHKKLEKKLEYSEKNVKKVTVENF